MYQLRRRSPGGAGSPEGRGLMVHREGVWPVERTISAGAGCRDVPVRRGGASLLLPSTGCV